jgi:hypothetical protein
MPGWGPNPAPFILSTPHHSPAWGHSFPGAFQSTLRRLEAQLAEYEEQLAHIAEAQGSGQLDAADAAGAEQLQAEYMRLADEYRRLVGG